MAGLVSITAPSAIGTIRIRDRRRTRRAPAGAIVPAASAADWPSYRAPRASWFASDDVRQFMMSFAAFFTAAMIFLA